jgi:hypothetical protein
MTTGFARDGYAAMVESSEISLRVHIGKPQET